MPVQFMIGPIDMQDNVLNRNTETCLFRDECIQPQIIW